MPAATNTVSFFAGVGAAAAAHAVRAVHPERVPLLRERVLHDGRRVPVLFRLPLL